MRTCDAAWRKRLAADEVIQYEPDDQCPLLVALGVGFQGVVLVLLQTVLCVTVIAEKGYEGDHYLTWAIFAALIISGVVTALQAIRLGRFGTRHMLITGATPNFIAISITALTEGGPELLASLMVASALFQFAMGAWLPLLRRIITPVVAGTVIMLIAVVVFPVAIERMEVLPEGAPLIAAPASALATLIVAVAMGLRVTGVLRLWSTLIGILAGCIVAVSLGAYDFQRVLDAPWVGIPVPELPGFELKPSTEFWSLLPMFFVVSLAVAIKSTGSSVIMQRVSWRRPRVTDFRLVQGAVNANGVGTLLSGVAGVQPTIPYDAVSMSLANLTGVAARRAGYFAAAILVSIAFLPKLTALLLSIPSPVLGTYLLVMMGMLFVEGMRTVVQDGLEFRNVLVSGVALSIGVGLQSQTVFADLLDGPWEILLNNSMTVGALAAILMTLFMELTSPRRRRLQTDLDSDAHGKIDGFLRELASNLGWNEASSDRLRLAGEEALTSLLQDNELGDEEDPRRLTVVARPGIREIELEFLAVLDDENLEDQISYLTDQVEVPEMHDIPLRLLRHYATSVRHRKYHGIDIITVQVEGSR